MKYIKILFILFSIQLSAQNDLKFDKRYVQSEDNWVAFPADSIGNYAFGFIYIDPAAGLTLGFSGTFKIDNKGKFVPKKTETVGFVKYRLKPNNNLVAFIPEARLKELDVDKIPDWLKSYKEDQESVEHLYKWGYMYNGWNEYEKALTYLEKAQKMNPNFKGLQTELAFSYNALKQYDKAVIALNQALKDNPNDCYSLKELAYAYQHLQKLDKSAEVYAKMASCSEKNYIQETAYNLAYQYYELKDKKNFTKWDAEVRKWGSESKYVQYLDNIKKEFN